MPALPGERGLVRQRLVLAEFHPERRQQRRVDRIRRPAQPSTRLSFHWHPLFIPIATPTTGTGGAPSNDSLAPGAGQRLLALAAAQPAPFFVAVGLHKPHSPYAYPAEIDALYPPATEIALPTAAARRVPVGMPDVAWEHCSAIQPFNESMFMPDLQALPVGESSAILMTLPFYPY